MEELEKQLFYLFEFLEKINPHLTPGVILPWVITLLISIPLFIYSKKLTTNCEKKSQALLEIIVEKLEGLIQEITGPEYSKRLMPLLSTIFIYILSANLLGLVPGLKSPTSIFSNCLGMAVIVFIFTCYLGIKEHGFSYIKHFTGNVWWMAPIMFPIHVIGEISHPISVTLRLFGNIMGEDTVIIVLTVALFPLLLPLPMMLMAIFSSFLQALVFTILSGIYFAGALSEAH